MFWNDPNLYGYTYREVPNVPTPFFGQTLGKFFPFAMAPWTTPQIPAVTPFYGMNFPVNPQVPPTTPFYGMNLPFNPLATQVQQPLPYPTLQQPIFPAINPINAIYGRELSLYPLPYRPF
jgi:hypothetical protein